MCNKEILEEFVCFELKKERQLDGALGNSYCLVLEKNGCLIFKDASANKGGVTSSSLEVLAALSLTEAEYKEWMMEKKDGFYDKYVEEVWMHIEQNAMMEFECLWRLKELTKEPLSVLSDKLSIAIITMKEQVMGSVLWENVELRSSVLMQGLPKLLLDKVGLKVLMERIPEAYLKAVFGTWLASRFVYKYGINAPQFAFFEFIGPLLK